MRSLLTNTRIVPVLALTIFAVAFTLPAVAAESTPVPVELKYIGQYNNQPVFELNMNGSEEKEFTVIIRDENNNVLYKENLKGETIRKKFMLDVEELGSSNLKFEIIGKKSARSFVYEVNKNSRQSENVVLNKTK